MAKTRADRKNYKRAFQKHAHSYDNWEKGSDISRRLLLCYCVECGLKCKIMQDNKIDRKSQADTDLEKVPGTHDFRSLLKAVKGAKVYEFKDFQTEYHEVVAAENFHQICRYCIEPDKGEMDSVNEFEKTLKGIAEWLKEEI